MTHEGAGRNSSSAPGRTASACGFQDTTTGEPCKNPVLPGSLQCAAGHPVQPARWSPHASAGNVVRAVGDDFGLETFAGAPEPERPAATIWSDSALAAIEAALEVEEAKWRCLPNHVDVEDVQVAAPSDPEHRSQRLRALLEALPERDQRILMMRDVERMTLRETGERLGVTRERIRQRHSAIMGRLRYGLRYALRAETTEVFAADAIYSLGLSERATNSLQRSGIRTISELTKRSPEDLLSIYNFGKQSLDEVVQHLADRGLALRPDEPRHRGNSARSRYLRGGALTSEG